MQIATLTSKSQVTVPKTVREALGIGPGDRIRFVPSLNGFRVVAIKGDVTALRGILKGRLKETLTVEDMNAAIAQAVLKRDRRSLPKAKP